MGMLSPEDIERYRLVHKKSYVAVCDQCGELIPSSSLLFVNSWGRRKDKLTFLGAVPTDVSCQTCNGLKTGTIKMVDGTAVSKVKIGDKVDNQDGPYFLRKLLLKMIKKLEAGVTELDLISRIQKKKDLDKTMKKKGVIRKTLREMKMLEDIKRSKGLWVIKPKKVKKKKRMVKS